MPVYDFVDNMAAMQAASDPSPVGGQQVLWIFYEGMAGLFRVPGTVVWIPSLSGIYGSNILVLQGEIETCMKLLGAGDLSELGSRFVSVSFPFRSLTGSYASREPWS